MSSRRTVILIAAIVIGALAAYAVVTYVGGVEDRANDNARRVPVVRVSGDGIPRGLTGQEAMDQGLLEETEIASEFFPPTAIEPEELEVIRAKAAVSDLAPGQVLVEDMFVDPINSQITAARRIQTDNVAITISVDNVRGVAGLIVPGDFVNILVTQDNDCETQSNDPNLPAPEGAEAPGAQPAVLCRTARYLYQQVQVLFVDASPIQLPGEAATATAADGTTPAVGNTGLLTLQVPPEAAQVIASAPADGFYLTLLPEDYIPKPLIALDPLIALLPGEDGALLTPYGPEGFPEDSNP